MEPLVQMIITVACSVIASSGFWAFLMQRRDGKDVKAKMLMGLAHDRIMFLATSYVERGFITADEYENLHDYLFVPYEKLGGNGTAKRIMMEVDKLPISKSDYEEDTDRE